MISNTVTKTLHQIVINIVSCTRQMLTATIRLRLQRRPNIVAVFGIQPNG